MRALAALLAAVALTILAGIVDGAYSGRWGPSPDLSKAGAVIEGLPETLGAWRRVADGDALTAPIQRELGLVNHLTRVYENGDTGRRIQLLVMVGRPGPLVRHPPTVCYANRAHEQLGDARWVAVSEEGADRGQFRLLAYRPARAQAGEKFFVAYGHSTDGAWDAPTFPRVAYGGAPALYKAQALMNVDGQESEAEAIDDLAGFLRALTGAFDRVAFQPPTAGADQPVTPPSDAL